MPADRGRGAELRRLARDLAPIGLACLVTVLILIVALVVVVGVWFGPLGHEHGRRYVVAAAIVGAIVAGCGLLPQTPHEKVIIYGRTAGPGMTWFGIVPPGVPPQQVGFGSNGAACLSAPPGAEVAWFDRSPVEGGHPVRTIGHAESGAETPTVLWVDVAADGSVTNGDGVPDWWVDDPTEC